MRSLLVAAVGSLSISQFAMANTFVGNSRTAVVLGEYPAAAVGKLLTASGDCTATLVAKNLILTASHCIFTNGKLKTGKFYFKLQQRITKITYFWFGNPLPETYQSDDWAIGKLESNYNTWIPVARVPPEQIATLPQTSLFSFSQDINFGNSLLAEYGCGVTQFLSQHNLLLHNCSTSYGASGAPLIYFPDPKNPKGAQIVAINTAQRMPWGENKTLINIPFKNDLANTAVSTNRFYENLQQALNQ